MDRRDPPAPTAAELEALLTAVLDRTSGPVCGRAHALLAEPDRAETDRRLLALHLEGCAECRALAAALAALARELPALAEVAPDPAFVADVLAQTSRAAAATAPPRRPARAPATPWVGLAAAWRRSWPRWVRRPRFAWEAAFVLTLVLSPVLAASGAPLQERVAELARESPVAALEEPAAAAEERLESARRSLAESTAARWVLRRLDAGEAAVASFGRAAGEQLVEVRAGVRTLFEAAASLLASGERTPSVEPDEPHEVIR